MRLYLFVVFLSLLCVSPISVTVDAVYPTQDFNALLQQYSTSPNTSWCNQCKAFASLQCPLGCAGDPGGGPCPDTACPSVFNFPLVDSAPVWNISISKTGSPYRAFSYIPICKQAGDCTESFFFSFSFRYIPDTPANNVMNRNQDYLKLLFWGDGNNILAIKNGYLLGCPYGGVGDSGIDNLDEGVGHAFNISFTANQWYHFAVQVNDLNRTTPLTFYVNGVQTGLTNKTVGISSTGLQFGAYIWGNSFFTVQYKDIAITKNLVTPTSQPPTATPTPTFPTNGSSTLSPTTTPNPPTTAPPSGGFPKIDFTSVLQQFATNTTTTWCNQCPAFPQDKCVMGCAGDPGGGSCPATACPNVYSFPLVDSSPVWNIHVSKDGDPYRAFSYIPVCARAGQCTESFFFSFSIRYIPDTAAGAPTPTNIFGAKRDYLKLLFWGDGNNMLAIKSGHLLGCPYGGVEDRGIGNTEIGEGHAFRIPFSSNQWYHIGVQVNDVNRTTPLTFYINGQQTGLTNKTVGISQFGFQFGAYVWGGSADNSTRGTFFNLQYRDIAITKNLPALPSYVKVNNDATSNYVYGTSSFLLCALISLFIALKF